MAASSLRLMEAAWANPQESVEDLGDYLVNGPISRHCRQSINPSALVLAEVLVWILCPGFEWSFKVLLFA